MTRQDHQRMLTLRMRNLARMGHPRAEELNTKADALDVALAAEPFDPGRVVGAWARARRVWSECTGEDLV